ncbi:MAG: hypothetical protein A3F70_17560 [Acidobacteria bacterium RIFCSPLOWO2_12_FULL_67_14]|nr:MAG: hypothetical protein A3H29_07490 [Acidobacteria bacterium RIFCSPLOWO2_02_FULL_67_21]OFW35655.1 MAG: hypothetical protein A3F70_17560 [Acidobacteria bacterium RIFCSPLOWO2_12_FULL_67_14]
MGSLEERITAVEAQTDAHTRAIDGLRHDLADFRAEVRTEIADLRRDMTAGDAALRAEVADIRRDMTAGDAALRVEINELRAEMSRRFDIMDQKFLWLAGTQVATLLAVVGVLAGALFR